jgi:hypothetical protein
MTGRRERRSKQLLDDLKGTRSYWKLKAEELDRTLWRTRFGRGHGQVVPQNKELVNKYVGKWARLPHRPMTPHHQILRNLSTRKQHIQRS